MSSSAFNVAKPAHVLIAVRQPGDLTAALTGVLGSISDERSEKVALLEQTVLASTRPTVATVHINDQLTGHVFSAANKIEAHTLHSYLACGTIYDPALLYSSSEPYHGGYDLELKERPGAVVIPVVDSADPKIIGNLQDLLLDLAHATRTHHDIQSLRVVLLVTSAPKDRRDTIVNMSQRIHDSMRSFLLSKSEKTMAENLLKVLITNTAANCSGLAARTHRATLLADLVQCATTVDGTTASLDVRSRSFPSESQAAKVDAALVAAVAARQAEKPWYDEVEQLPLEYTHATELKDAHEQYTVHLLVNAEAKQAVLLHVAKPGKSSKLPFTLRAVWPNKGAAKDPGNMNFFLRRLVARQAADARSENQLACNLVYITEGDSVKRVALYFAMDEFDIDHALLASMQSPTATRPGVLTGCEFYPEDQAIPIPPVAATLQDLMIQKEDILNKQVELLEQIMLIRGAPLAGGPVQVLPLRP